MLTPILILQQNHIIHIKLFIYERFDEEIHKMIFIFISGISRTRKLNIISLPDIKYSKLIFILNFDNMLILKNYITMKMKVIIVKIRCLLFFNDFY